MPRKKGDIKLQTARAIITAKPVPIPEFVELTPAAKALWPFFVSARISNDWHDVDLVLLARACQLEIDIARCRAQLEASGYVITDRFGEPKPNPLVRIIGQFAREQMAIFSRLALGKTAHDHGKARKNALQGRVYEAAFSLDDDNLLARPR